MSLILAFRKTIHSAQGMSIGPVSEGQGKNTLEKCIVNIGIPRMESNNPGLLYTALSRATTIGNTDDLLSSAIYFEGCHMSYGRLKDVNSRHKLSHKTVQKRKEWVQYLKEHEKVLTKKKEKKDTDDTAVCV